ncbi:dienelactone hydrolase family protein [Rhodococcus sp. IEGM 1401]|uniref:Dienelactone hydrolase family protein n=2 Tax=Rhodococcus cerastii TaxID=908616 RepID=A0ABU4D0G4_9NOCA|nr:MULTISPECIES: dienelactone hydrolase family protein [unclassified Rhodococcus (in: high G+C Gram-positive bacteria)]MDV6303213.1 dienelactone hydrolase family protein [Rhodococcus cerastii]MCZ4563874.1 dienelactone hydrolase family protein [Rhodococcus sp. IEGM 1401]MDI9923975.1 dienelactone hydrolase family protein [Rhodococcus sp. IEGM 1372]MDV8034780.1 dienelactone hydrolase family protein [Rhodococcus sp. IEGM 1414]MDV8077036.1 dienelactone hydrolase family protein [Rhodococcus sp. IEGM
MPSSHVQIPMTDGAADAFVTYPDGDGPHPAVLLYMDIFGVRPVLEAMARELAEHGYYVLVPNLFYRHGPAPVVELPELIDSESRPALVEKLMPLLAEHTADRARADAEDYLAFLDEQPAVGAGKVAVVGYCMGGVLAIRTAAAFPDRVSAAASFHPGKLVTDEPGSPHRLLLDVAATSDRSAGSTLAAVHIGHADGDMTPEALDELDGALDAAGLEYTSEVYPGAVHGFTMADTTAFDAAALQRHWDRLLPLLERTIRVG